MPKQPKQMQRTDFPFFLKACIDEKKGNEGQTNQLTIVANNITLNLYVKLLILCDNNLFNANCFLYVSN